MKKIMKETLKKIQKICNIKELIEKYKKSRNSFTRNRKLNFEMMIYYILNKKGLTTKMEIEEFRKIMKLPEISDVAVFKKREQISGEIFNYMRDINLDLFYNKYKKEVKTYKGYLLIAVDGSYFEVPNTKETRKMFNSKKNNTGIPRALVENHYDVLNGLILSTEIGKETDNEAKLDEIGYAKIKELKISFPKIRIKDRGYVNIRDFYSYPLESKDKYIVRLKKQDFRHEIEQMKSNDEIIEIKYEQHRMRHYKKTNIEFYNEITKTKKNIYTRIVKIKLSNGTEEILATNLSQEEITKEEMKEIYNLRWQIELSYHTLKVSMKAETITSSKRTLIEQDIYSQMFVFNLLQEQIMIAQKEIDKKRDKYKYEMKINKNMSVGFFKQILIYIIIEENNIKKDEMYNIFLKNIEKYAIPVRKDRIYPRKRERYNKHSITKRKSF